MSQSLPKVASPKSGTVADGSVVKPGLWRPLAFPITQIVRELPDIDTYWLTAPDDYRFLPGQFNMIYMPGYGEAAISISSDPDQPHRLGHTIRAVGDVTRALRGLKLGSHMLLRGPFGTPWPIEQCLGNDLVIACGGLGLAPLRPVIYYVLNHREQFGAVHLLYGTRTPNDLLFPDEYAAWQAGGIELQVTVDQATSDWRGKIGVVTQLMRRIKWKPSQTRVLTCGPEIMMRFVAYEAIANQVEKSSVFLSMERNMKCAIGLCGHCQWGPSFVCKDGPVYPYSAIESYLTVEDL